jgi:hypothetical protein
MDGGDPVTIPPNQNLSACIARGGTIAIPHVATNRSSSQGIRMEDSEPAKGSLSASDSMDHIPVPLSNVPMTTPVPSAALDLTVHNRALRDQLFPIVTPLKHERWHALLKVAHILKEFADVPAGIQHEFNLGLCDTSLTTSFIPNNHFKLPEHRDFILSKYREEINCRLLSQGYPLEFLENIIGPI